MTYCQSLQMSVCQIKQEFCCFCHRFWSQQIRNCILMAEGEEWDLGDRSPHHEIQPSPPKPRNNTRWVPLPQPATPPPPRWPTAPFFFFLYLPNLFFPRHQMAAKQTSVQGSIMFFFLSKMIFKSLFGCLCAILLRGKKRRVNDTRGIAVFCMYVCMF